MKKDIPKGAVSTKVPPAEVDPIDLPENAFRELAADEEYRPLMHPAREYQEVTPYSVTMGLILAVVFSAAAAYLGLKVGQVFEAAIPIAIIAVGVSSALKKNNALGQNIIIQSIGGSSGVIVAGAIFTLPALYILQAKYPEITVSYLEIFLSSLFGGVLGILFFIPFRKYFVKDMHGKYPFPEATATTQVLVSGNTQAAGKSEGGQAKLLLMASLVGGIYDYVVATFGFWAETVTTAAYSWGQTLSEKFKFVFSCNTGAALLGLGYIVGLKYAFVIFAGSVFVWWVIMPLMGAYGSPEIQAMDAGTLFYEVARKIGIGGIAMAGVIGIIKSWPIITQAVGLAGRELKGSTGNTKSIRWQQDISMKHIAYFVAIALIAVLVFFWLGVIHTFWQALIAWLVVAVIAFLFTTVAANAIAIVGSNPVSGMTLMTLIIASAVFVAIGLKGASGMVASMVIGGVVCTALSMAGGLVTDLKVGYWLGSTPPQTGAVEVPGYTSVSGYRRRRNHAAQQGLRLCRPRRTVGSAGQRHGIGTRTHDDRSGNTLDSLHHRRHTCRTAQLARRTRPRLLSGHVHQSRTQHTHACGRSSQLLCSPLDQRCQPQPPAQRPRYPHSIGTDCRRCIVRSVRHHHQDVRRAVDRRPKRHGSAAAGSGHIYRPLYLCTHHLMQ